MAESRRLYRWRVRWDDELMATAALDRAAVALERWRLARKWFMKATIDQPVPGTLQIEVTLRGRDQWMVHRRQLAAAVAVAAALRLRRSQLGEPEMVRLMPHSNRGKMRLAARGAKQADGRVAEE